MDLPSRLDLFALGRDYIVQRAQRIDPSQIDTLGSDANVFIGSQSCVADTVVRQLAYSVARLTLDGAEGDDLDRYAWDKYTLIRKGASNAVGSVTFSRSTTAAGAGSVPVGTILTSLTGVQYITTTVAAFGSSDVSSTANVRAIQAGKTSQVGANAIRKFASISSLWDTSLLVTNPVATAGGEDVEDDDTFRARIRNFWNAARRGTLGAIEFGALTVAGVVSAQAFEALTSGGQPARVVSLYIADSSGVANSQLAALVQTALLEFRAAGITVLIVTSIPLIVSVQLSLQFQANVDSATLTTNIQAAIYSFINSLPVNGTLYIGQLYSVLQRFVPDGLVLTQGTIVSPTGDLVPAVGQTLRTTLANITTVSH